MNDEDYEMENIKQEIEEEKRKLQVHKEKQKLEGLKEQNRKNKPKNIFEKILDMF